MEIFNIQKIYLIYALHCKVTDRYYIGSSSNLNARLNTHLSSYKTGCSKCYSRFILEGNNYELLLLKNNIQDKQICKKFESNFISAYGSSCVNKNRPILVDIKQYHKEYYLQRKQSVNPLTSNMSVSSDSSSN